jgi:asparagine synthase (glutamine-hydrolysing)
VDSVALASLAATVLGADVHGFTIMNTDPRYEERRLVEEAVRVLDIEHTWVPLSTSGFLERLQDLTTRRGEPLLTLSSYVQALLMDEIAAHGYRVVVGGIGADELFTGYFDHHLFYLASIDPEERSTARSWWEQRVRPIVRNPFLQDPETFIIDPEFRGHILLEADNFNSTLLEPIPVEFSETKYHGTLIRNRMLNELFHEAVPVLLHEEDLNAMHYSLENRSPFLDRRLMEFAFTIPTPLLMRHGYTKAVLREAVRGIAPDAVLDSPRKVGFNVPIGDLLPLTNPSVREAILEDSAIWDIVDRDIIAARLNRYQSTNSHSKFLFSLVSAKAFLDSLA